MAVIKMDMGASDPFTTSSVDIFATCATAKSQTPTGGVTRPSVNVMTMTTRKVATCAGRPS